jgi:hypothetical protein
MPGCGTLLGEVEAVFGFWAAVLMLFMFALQGKTAGTAYLDSRNYTEPLFVFAIMVIAGTRPILQMAEATVRAMVRAVPLAPWPGAVLRAAGDGAPARIVHHRAGGHDAGCADAARRAVSRTP